MALDYLDQLGRLGDGDPLAVVLRRSRIAAQDQHRHDEGETQVKPKAAGLAVHGLSPQGSSQHKPRRPANHEPRLFMTQIKARQRAWAYSHGEMRNRGRRDAMGRFVLLFVLLLLAFAPGLTPGLTPEARADAETGWQAYLAGNYQSALAALRPPAEAGDPAAQYALGALHSDGLAVPRSYREAARWYEKAAAQGHRAAQFSLGFLYYYGAGVDSAEDPVARDPAKAARWLTPAAEGGEAMAQYLLGHLYHTGEGVPEDEDMALRWILPAAERGILAAQAEAGVLLGARHHGFRGWIEAAKWLILASRAGVPGAGENLAKLKQRLNRNEIEEAEDLAEAWRPARRAGAIE
jgi:hypothetical protein